MKKNFIRFFAVCSFFAILTSSVFAENAVVTSVKGKVEVNHGDDKWVALSVGDKILESDVVSTGFQSEAKIKYSGSVMLLGALTRVTLKQLSSTASTEKVDVFLNTGAVRSKVTHTDDKKVNYQVRGAVAVASVRGTDFLSTADGTVKCFEGAVAVYPAKYYVEETKEESSVEEEAENEEENEEGESSGEEDSEGDNSDESLDNNPPDESEPPANEPPEGNNEPPAENNNQNNETENQGPANANTPANEIDRNAPGNSTVVAENQTGKVDARGGVKTPFQNFNENVNKNKDNMNSKASEEAEGGDNTTSEIQPKKGNLKIIVDFE